MRGENQGSVLVPEGIIESFLIKRKFTGDQIVASSRLK